MSTPNPARANRFVRLTNIAAGTALAVLALAAFADCRPVITLALVIGSAAGMALATHFHCQAVRVDREAGRTR